MIQIFQKPIPKKILLDLLNSYCEKNNEYFIFSKIAFQKNEIKTRKSRFFL